jgi:tetratricopeptide (TPR) repeat protein
LPADVAAEVGRLTEPSRSSRVQQALAEAARMFERGRYRDAERVLARLVVQVPGSAAVRELRGLTLYRLGRWRPAVKELEAFRALSGSVEQHPVLADCRRALGQHRQVGKLWEELREASPDAGLVAEGRIVAAGSLADQGEVRQAIKLLERAPTEVRRPRLHHLRLWYALADLYERAGDVPSARELFRRVAHHQPDFADAAERLASLD